MLRSVIGQGAALKWEHILGIKRSRVEERASLARRFIVYNFLAPETTVTFRVRWTTCRDLLQFRLTCEEILKQKFIAALTLFDINHVLKFITFERCRCSYLLLRLERGTAFKPLPVFGIDNRFLCFSQLCVEPIFDLVLIATCHFLRYCWPLAAKNHD